MRILVTGAAGYIGSALVRALPAAEVVATDQSAPAPVIGNLAYPQFARSLITPEIGTVFHLASLVSGGAEQNFELGTKVNLDATRDLLEACRLAGRDYVCPVRPGTRLACISLKKVVESFVHAAGIEAERLGPGRTLLLNGVGASAQEMWDAVRPRAKGRVRFAPDPAVQPVVDGAPRSTSSRRSMDLGFPASASIEEIVGEYEEAAFENHS